MGCGDHERGEQRSGGGTGAVEMRGWNSSKFLRRLGQARAALGFVCVYQFQMSRSAVTEGSMGFKTQGPLLTLLLHHRVQGKHEIEESGMGVGTARGILARGQGTLIP